MGGAKAPPAERHGNMAELKKEKLLEFTVTVYFVDGNLREFFERYGYDVDWRPNEVRKIPAWLAQRCIQSGAQLERAD